MRIGTMMVTGDGSDDEVTARRRGTPHSRYRDGDRLVWVTRKEGRQKTLVLTTSLKCVQNMASLISIVAAGGGAVSAIGALLRGDYRRNKVHARRYKKTPRKDENEGDR
jgi:hypothetical protein